MTTASDRPLGTQHVCPTCGELVEWREYVNAVGRSLRYWTECACIVGAWGRAQERSAASVGFAAALRVAPTVSDVRAIADFTLDTFDASRLAGGDKLLRAAREWLDRALALPYADRSYDNPRACLYFYSPGKGRGKTHLAAGIALAARAVGKLVAFTDEISFLERYWAASLEERAQIAHLPAEQAWLTVFDDMGSRENTPPGVRDAWYDLIGPRWMRRGWTIITSNRTLDELVEHDTIDDRIYSRLYQMTQGKIVTFDGSDQRLAGVGQ